MITVALNAFRAWAGKPSSGDSVGKEVGCWWAFHAKRRALSAKQEDRGEQLRGCGSHPGGISGNPAQDAAVKVGKAMGSRQAGFCGSYSRASGTGCLEHYSTRGPSMLPGSNGTATR